MIELQKRMQAQFDRMCVTGKLFRSSLTGNQVWDLYLAGFQRKDDPVFRDPASSVHNCNLCKNFVRRYGNIVAFDGDLNLISIWDVEAPEEFIGPCASVSGAIQAAGISNVFFETYAELNSLPYESCSKTNTVFKLGIAKNVKRYTKEEAEKFGVVKPNEIRTFDHMHLSIPSMYVYQGADSIDQFMAKFRDNKNVFQRAMEEIHPDTYRLVLDLITQGSLLNGDAYKHKLLAMIPAALDYASVPAPKKDAWFWVNSFSNPNAKFKNELIGTLCTELSEGKELNAACLAWNKRVDPANYMKATAPITQRQIEEARQFVQENGYEESFDRRHATIDDIKASEIKHINVGDGSVKSVSIFDSVKSTSTRHKRSEFDNIEEVPVEKFMAEILPQCTSVEALLLNRHDGNMVSLTTSKNKDSKPLFKWPNNYSWTFNGNLAGKSMIKDAVSERGGKVDGVLRFSIMWGEGDSSDDSDLDAWASEPSGVRIGFNTGYRKDSGNERSRMSGQLDVDIQHPASFGHKNIVENIAWIDKSRMHDGDYQLWVNQYSARNSKGFTAEVEFDGETYSYGYDRPVSGNVQVAVVTLKNGEFSIKHLLPESSFSKPLYSLPTSEFHKVKLVCLSPNHWGESVVGAKHYFFMLNECKCDGEIRGFHIENLLPDLAQHRKVLEVLGNTTSIPQSDRQLSGLGFNSTVRDELVVRLQGSFKRVIKIKF